MNIVNIVMDYTIEKGKNFDNLILNKEINIFQSFYLFFIFTNGICGLKS
jgi:hypothetical protein